MAFDHRSKAQMSSKQVFVQKEKVWDSEEFDNENDLEYEVPDQEEDRNYICPLADPQTEEGIDKSREANDEQSASADIMKPPRHRKQTKYLESSFREGRIKAFGSSTKKLLQPKTPKTKDTYARANNLIPAPPEPTQTAPANNYIPGPKQDLDPSWYGGKVTRHQAEVFLRGMNKDGAFVVRDSSQGSAEHPYTLMLLKHGKVFNIKICNHGNFYSLGTYLHNTKSFPGVKEMITHYTHTPLLLIDGTDSSKVQSQCCLLHPAGL